MEYQGFTLDQFQVDAIGSIEINNSVVVSASTGTGKTLIADYIIDKAINEGKKVFYTAPIKALSNQKYKDFTRDYGSDKVGIMTGDLVIRPEAQIVVMTTEIYRNMLMVKDPAVDDVSYVIFDEIHFINDIERGVVWEESIIFSPEHVRFLALSATIPNAQEFADWISSIKNHTVDVVNHLQRAVPLSHYVFDSQMGVVPLSRLRRQVAETEDVPVHKKGKKRRSKQKALDSAPSHIDLAKSIRKNGTPAILFTFSRKACEGKAWELAKSIDPTGKQEKQRIIKIIKDNLQEEIKLMQSTKRLRQVLPKGIGYHHAGMLPNQKEIIEILFAEGLIRYLYATETFAVGINMPAKTVCFNSLQKYDGINFRYLYSKEYYQMAGRAGRRGIDKEGRAIAIVNRELDDFTKISSLTAADKDPIISQFHLSYNTVINLLNNYSDEEIGQILKSNFDYYIKSQNNKRIKIMNSWKNRVRVLYKMGFITQDNELTQKGWFCRFIYTNELLVSEIFASELYTDFSIEEIILTMMAVTYEPRRGYRFYKQREGQKLADNLHNKLSRNDFVARKINSRVLRNLAPMVRAWAGGCEFAELLYYSNLAEGDLVRMFRQAIDLMRQVRSGTNDVRLRDLLKRGQELIDRDVIQAQF